LFAYDEASQRIALLGEGAEALAHGIR